MREVTVELVTKVPCEATDAQVEEWVKYQTGVYGGMNKDNPLAEYDLDGIDATVLC